MIKDRGRNPLILLFAGVLAYLIYGHYSTGRDLRRICELIGSHDAGVTIPSSPRQEINNICINHRADEAF